MNPVRVAIALVLLAAPLGAQSASTARPAAVDPRIQSIPYDPNQVTVLRGTLGYQFMIEFAPDEHIDTVSVGDSLGWQVTPNRKANVLFIKPIDRGSVTNLTVLTDQRRYAFELTVAPKGDRTPVLFIARMAYPQPVLLAPTPPPAPDPPPVEANSAYSFTGAVDSRPARVFDDGRQTYFEWPADSAVPAIFAVSQDGAETLVNSAVRGSLTVVEQLAPRFVLRNGASVTQVTNNGYPAAAGHR